MSSNLTYDIRPAHDDDLPAIETIYAYHVLRGTGSFEEEPPSLEEMRQRFKKVQACQLPYLVATTNDQIIGFAYAQIYNGRSSYRFTAEDSVYVASEWRGHGIGKRLLTELLKECVKAGMKQIIAVIGGGSENPSSIRLHQKLGFEEVGRLKKVGFKFNQWLDVVFMQKELRPRN